MMLALSWAYFRWSDVAAVSDLFDGIKPAVIAILTVTLWRLVQVVGEGRPAARDHGR